MAKKAATEITYEEFQKAYEIVERYKYQQNRTIQVSVEYSAKVSVTVRMPDNLSISEIKEELKKGYYHYQTDDEPSVDLIKITDLIVNGEEIKL